MQDEPVENVAMCFADLKRKKKKKRQNSALFKSRHSVRISIIIFILFISDRQCMNIKHNRPFTVIKTEERAQNTALVAHAFQVWEELSS